MRPSPPPLISASAGIALFVAGCATTSRMSPPRSQPSDATPPPAERPAAARADAAAPVTRDDATPPPVWDPRYSTGRSMQDFEAPAGKVAGAVLEAMDDLKIAVNRRGHDGAAAQIDGRTPDRRTVTVTLRVDKPITHVSCRIGWFGDEPMSRALLRRVAIRLGTLPPEAIPEEVPSSPSPNPYFSRDAVPDAEIMRDYIEAPYRTRPDM